MILGPNDCTFWTKSGLPAPNARKATKVNNGGIGGLVAGDINVYTLFSHSHISRNPSAEKPLFTPRLRKYSQIQNEDTPPENALGPV